MNPSSSNRFEDFFANDAYVLLKNYLYNYLLRRRAVRKCLQSKMGDLILEVGSGLSPMMEASERIIYSELSYAALQTLKRSQGLGCYVVADATHLPFKGGSFSQVICSEVIEHLPEDQPALREMASAIKPGGSLVLTFPHRHCYFADDDRFVNHYRRYEMIEIKTNLEDVGLKTIKIQKVLGPLEKITMLSVISLIQLFDRFHIGKHHGRRGNRAPLSGFLVTFFVWFNRLYCFPVWLDARLAPCCLSSVLLVLAVRQK